ncbi:hypothetical protein KP509_08G037200 [Ceratopteris richardii]|uniref:Uncharacterized protein n=1 Tax=Ceratopteris richardii TaxID=49495 RepID=A0A8T2U9M6_CERRI|nr:hypothetical protein KP509_08G037200 [Ceratopteris richardii]
MDFCWSGSVFQFPWLPSHDSNLFYNQKSVLGPKSGINCWSNLVYLNQLMVR